MRIVVFGGTGGTGRALLRKLLADSEKHTSVAVCRNPAALDDVKAAETGSSRLEVVQGDLFDAASVAATVQGADVVVFTAGIPDIKTAATKKTTIYSVGGKNMLDAMQAADVKRLVAVTSQGVIHDPSGSWLYNYFLRTLVMGDMYRDMTRLETLITESNNKITYTILRPTKLEDDPSVVGGSEQLCVGEGYLPADKSCSHKVLRSELADTIIAAVKDEAKYAGKVLHVSH